jgi:hypothetical protein
MVIEKNGETDNKDRLYNRTTSTVRSSNWKNRVGKRFGQVHVENKVENMMVCAKNGQTGPREECKSYV